jgi:hypothetical protein
MEALNPEKVYYYLNSDRVLKASCQEPIEIINHQLGYRILYVLQSFEHDYRTQSTTFYGMPFFEELIPQSSREKENWEKKRQEVYAISLNRFLRALYRKQIHEEGFLLVDQDTLGYSRIIYSLEEKEDKRASLEYLKEKEGIRVSPVSLEDIVQIEQNIALLNTEETLFLFCNSKPVTEQIIQLNYNAWVRDWSTSILKVGLFPQQITIYPDGTYSGLLKIVGVNKYLNGLSSMVPVEYPEIAGLAQ